MAPREQYLLQRDGITKSLEVVLAGAITTDQLPFVTSFIDLVPYAPGENDGTTNGTTPVTTVTAPSTSTRRDISFVQIHNADTAAATVTVRYNNNSTTRTIIEVILAVGSQLIYTDEDGRGASVAVQEVADREFAQPEQADLRASPGGVVAREHDAEPPGVDHAQGGESANDQCEVDGASGPEELECDALDEVDQRRTPLAALRPRWPAIRRMMK